MNTSDKGIGTISSFLEKVKTIEKPKDGYLRFYRGQPVDKPLIPNIFRDDCFKKHESEIYNEIVNRKPEEFINCKCTFDHLVKMQHYNIPTRLLDITSNPLIALYFALSSNNLAEPTVYCLDIPTYHVKNYNSDNVTILSNLARYDEYSKENLLYDVATTNKIIEIFALKILSAFTTKFKSETFSQGYLMQILEDKTLRDKVEREIEIELSKDYNTLKKNISIGNELISIMDRVKQDRPIFSAHIENIDRAKAMVTPAFYKIEDHRFLHEIKQDKPYFLDLMNVETFNTIFCVKPRLNNPRLIKQNGAFLLFPHATIKLQENIKITQIGINKSLADDILKDLSILDINKDSLFNDIDNVSTFIKEKYNKMS